jgi:L-fuculose-phosphate aldolase
VDDAAARVIETTRRLVTDGLCIGTAGNVSVRDGDGILITPSGVDPDELGSADLCRVSRDGAMRTGGRGREPSSELAMHLAAYDATGAGAVVHTHSPFATVLSTTHDELPAIHYLVAQLGGPVRVAPYALFGTAELAASLRAALDGRSAALLQNHGALTVGADLAQAHDRARLLEWLCALYWRALQAGPPRLLTDEELAAAADQFRRVRYGEGG